MSKPRFTIAVTGLNAIDSPGPGIAVIRALKESPDFDVRIVGLAYESLEPGIYMHEWVDKTYQVPFPSMGNDTLLQRLEVIHRKEKLDVIIPNFDAEIFTYIKLRPALESMGIGTLLPTAEQFDMRLKSNLVEFGEALDIKIPRSETVLTLGELDKKLDEFDFPVFVKGKYYEAYKAYSKEQAHSYFHKLSAKWGTPIILQQMVQGQELNVTALGDGKGTLIGAVPMRKTYITETGKGWAGVSIDDPSLVAMADKVISQTKWGGGMELELIKEDATGDVYLIEINPRFPAWVYLSAGCGQNHPAALVKLIKGLPVEPFKEYQVGKMFIRYSFDMLCDLNEFAHFSMTGEL